MSQTPLSNEQKLEYIYRILVRQEKARKFAQNMKIVKWVLILGIVFFALQNPEKLMTGLTRYLQPMVMNSMSGVIEDQKMKSLQDMQKMLQDVQNNNF